MIPTTLLLLSLAFPAQETSPPKPALAKPDRWVIRLADGSLYRGTAREVAGGFELRRRRAWEAVAARDVGQAVRESVLLADLAERRREAAANPGRRVDIARWALGRGLLEESVAELDAALAADPDSRAARDLVATAPLALTLPGEESRSLGERLVYFGARARPAYRELAAVRLIALPREEALAELTRGLASPSASVRAFAAFGLRRLDPRARAGALVRRAVVDPSEPARFEAARVLRDARDEELARRVAAALDLPDSRLRTFAAESLGEMGYRSAVPAIAARLRALQSGSHPGGYRANIKVGSQVAYVQDYDLEIAQGASIADPIVAYVDDATVLDVRVGGTSVQRVQVEGQSLCRALGRLTGEKLPEEPAAWLAWYERNAASFAESVPATGVRAADREDG